MRVLIDQCIVSHGETMQGVSIARVLGIKRREKPQSFPQWKRSEYECLPTIAKLISEKRISPFSYTELWFEGTRRRNYPRIGVGDLFDIPRENHLDSPIERGFFFSTDVQTYAKRESVVKFCVWLNALNVEEFVSVLRGRPWARSEMIKAATQLPRYQALCRGLAEGQYPDAYHLWTGEMSGMQRFLTMDRKLINVMRETKTIQTPCPLVSPSELLTEFGVQDRAPFRHQVGVVYAYSGSVLSVPGGGSPTTPGASERSTA